MSLRTLPWIKMMAPDCRVLAAVRADVAPPDYLSMIIDAIGLTEMEGTTVRRTG